MATKSLPDIAALRNRVAYDPATGALTWLPRPINHFRPTRFHGADVRMRCWNTRCAGKPAFSTVGSHGYMFGTFEGWPLLAHRVAFALLYGHWPKVVDHIDGDRLNNRAANLREVDYTGNAQNTARRRNLVPGVEKAGKRWRARIKAAGRTKRLGTFDTFEEAVEAKKAAEAQYGYHPNHGR